MTLVTRTVHSGGIVPAWRRAAVVVIALALPGCGGGGSSSPSASQPVTVNTLAYVDNGCRVLETDQFISRQALKIRQRSGETITAMDFPMFGPFPGDGCISYGKFSDGPSAVLVLPFQRLGVSPDGSTVVFEVTDQFSIFTPPPDLISPEQEGIFAVRADGSGLRKLGPPSRDASWRVGSSSNSIAAAFNFSPDGRLVAFTDVGSAPDGTEAVEVMTLELATGTRKQITQLPPLTPVGFAQTVSAPSFLDARRVVFTTNSVEDGLTFVIVYADGSGEISREKPPVEPTGPFIPEFVITQPGFAALSVPLSKLAENPLPGSVSEIFVVGSADVGGSRLQLTGFGRSDTGNGGVVVSRDGSQVLFTATADPFVGLNRDANCQFFSIDVLGASLHQVTTLANGEHNSGACGFPGEMGCGVSVVGQDGATDTVVFASTCDPLSGNSDGNNVFAMGFDGSGVVQLTNTHGLTTETDGTVDVELPGPVAYPQVFR